MADSECPRMQAPKDPDVPARVRSWGEGAGRRSPYVGARTPGWGDWAGSVQREGRLGWLTAAGGALCAWLASRCPCLSR